MENSTPFPHTLFPPIWFFFLGPKTQFSHTLISLNWFFLLGPYQQFSHHQICPKSIFLFRFPITIFTPSYSAYQAMSRLALQKEAFRLASQPISGSELTTHVDPLNSHPLPPSGPCLAPSPPFTSPPQTPPRKVPKQFPNISQTIPKQPLQ